MVSLFRNALLLIALCTPSFLSADDRSSISSFHLDSISDEELQSFTAETNGLSSLELPATANPEDAFVPGSSPLPEAATNFTVNTPQQRVQNNMGNGINLDPVGPIYIDSIPNYNAR